MTATRSIGKCVLHDEFASGGMASVFIGQLIEGHVTKTVAVKRLHRHVAATAGGVAMFEDEARLSAVLRHPNIVATLEVVREDDELLLVMEYIHGVSLSALERRARERDEPIPLSIVAAIMRGMLLGLESAHRATDPQGNAMHIVHRDVSPQNVIVGADGVARVLDFGIAKAATQLHTTRDGQLKGKLRYMAPEQLTHDDITLRTDVYGAAVVCWELLTGEKLFVATSEGRTVAKVLEGVIIPPSRVRPNVPEALDAIVMRGLARAPEARFASCQAMADALAVVISRATETDVGAWVAHTAPEELRASAARIESMERGIAIAPDKPGPRPENTVTFERADKPPVAALAPAGPPEVVMHSAPAGAGPRSRGKLAIAATALIATAAMAWFAFAARDSDRTSTGARAEPPATRNPEPVASATSSTSGEVAATSSAATPESATAPSALPSSAPSSAVAAPRASAARFGPAQDRRPIRPSSRPAPASSRPNCSPIYTTGPDGIRRIKPECL